MIKVKGKTMFIVEHIRRNLKELLTGRPSWVLQYYPDGDETPH